jgi:hypothetical protein
MRILLSEARPDYAGYVFPYAVWGFPEEGDSPARALELGFLPSSRDLSRWYLCRQVRVPLDGFRPNSENRRILRKGEGIRSEIVPLADFQPTPERIELCFQAASARWSSPPTRDRIESIFRAPYTTHVALFREPDGSECGIVPLLLDGSAAFYSNAFPRVGHPFGSLGMFLMTETVRLLAEAGLRHAHLGTCYSNSALYKTAFDGVEFFDGLRWSSDLASLKHLLGRQESGVGHLLEDADWIAAFLPGGLAEAARDSRLRL